MGSAVLYPPSAREAPAHEECGQDLFRSPILACPADSCRANPSSHNRRAAVACLPMGWPLDAHGCLWDLCEDGAIAGTFAACDTWSDAAAGEVRVARGSTSRTSGAGRAAPNVLDQTGSLGGGISVAALPGALPRSVRRLHDQGPLLVERRGLSWASVWSRAWPVGGLLAQSPRSDSSASPAAPSGRSPDSGAPPRGGGGPA